LQRDSKDMRQIKYKGAYKYQLVDDYSLKLEVFTDEFIETDYIIFGGQGYLKIKAGYAWDGPSGPVLDTVENMRASLIHDALYQLLREEWLPQTFRQKADAEFRRLCIVDGVKSYRAWCWYVALRIGGNPAASPENAKIVNVAPRN
jgi:hypothetical protein